MPIVEIPICETCFEEDGFQCRVCHKWVCWSCLVITRTGPNTEVCYHVKPTAKSNPTWRQQQVEEQDTLNHWAPDAMELKRRFAPDLFVPEIDAPEPEEDD